MTQEQQRLFDRISIQCPDIIDLRRMALAFRAALTGGESGKLRQWIERVRRCGFGAVVRFADGLKKELAAVESSWSTGQVEGQINRPKTIKRQMYARPGFELLRARVLPYSPAMSPGPAP
jgi:transposase